jgi:hypothetical protein
MIAALMVITYVPSVSLWLPVQSKQLKVEEVEKSTFMRKAKAEEPIKEAATANEEKDANAEAKSAP